MKLCFAATNGKRTLLKNKLNELKYVLESFYYIEPWQVEEIKDIQHFMLDSGAFTFLNSKKANIDIDNYVDKYIEFIKDNDIQHFFELDIDSVAGYDEVKRIRRKIERKTKKRCIPVWHKSRGLQDYKDMCKKYDYVAIGGIVTKEIKPREHFLLNALCDYAHEQNCKIHALGFTPGNLLKYRFDSVDSASWKFSGIYGRLNNFDSGVMKIYRPERRMKSVEYDIHNINEWKKYQQYIRHKRKTSDNFSIVC